jgi:PAS domain S-box-containing protein
VARGKVSQAIASTASREELFGKVCRILVEYGGLYKAFIAQRVDDQAALVPKAAWGGDRGFPDLQATSVEQLKLRGEAATSYLDGRSYICNDVEQDPVLKGKRRDQWRAIGLFPIKQAGGFFGALGVYSVEAGYFQVQEIALLSDAAAELALAVDNFEKTEQHRQAQAEVEREMLFSHAVLESLPGFLCLCDENGKFLRWNRNFAAVSGYSDEEIAGMRPWDFSSSDQPLARERFYDALREGSGTVEAPFLTKDGRSIPHLFISNRLVFDGNVCLVTVGLDISERKRAEAALAEYSKQLRAMSREVFAVQENERRQLARDLHDTVGQELTALSLNLAMIRGSLPADLAAAVSNRIEDSQRLLEETSRHVRGVMTELRPPGLNELGLLAALKEHGGRVAQRTGLRVSIGGIEARPRFAPEIAIALFRIMQEALNNAVKHAAAATAAIELFEWPERYQLQLTDDGRGFDPAAAPKEGDDGLGLTSMRERAEAIGAHLTVQSHIGGGTRVAIEIPRVAAEAAAPAFPAQER